MTKHSLHGRVLVLNSSYEPFSTMDVAQAMRKLSKSDCVLQVLEWADGRTLRTPNGEYPVPSVIRLTYYLDIHKRRNKSGSKRLSIYQRDKFKCQYCNIKVGQKHSQLLDDKGKARKMNVGDLTLDHIYPRSRGGETRPDNLVTACLKCNHRKADRTPEEARMPLLTPQTMLRVHLDRLKLCSYAEYQPEWKKYLFLESAGDQSLTHTGTDG